VQAILMIEQANLHSQQIANQDGASEAITIDLMRRAGLFQQALKLAENIKEKDIEGIIMQVVEYEVALIQSKDIDSHTISEAIGEGTIQEASDDG
jgi:transcriptional regulator NrdR family protein